MSIDEILSLDLDTVRFVLVASIGVAVLVYLKFWISEGGTLTVGYLAILALSGHFGVIATTLVAAAVAYLMVRVLLTRWLALTKQWVFIACVLVGTIANSAIQLGLRETGPIELPWGLSLVLYAGSFIIPGLIAYDVARQGLRVTAIGAGLTLVGTLAVVVPVLALANWLQPESTTIYVSTTGRIPEGLFWLGSIATVLFSGALRLSFTIRTGGFIAPLFIVEVLSIPAVVTIFAAALAAHLIANWLKKHVTWSPRLRFQFTVMLGAMAAWTGLYWGARVGWQPALEANAYALEPLLAVALIAADMGRADSTVPRTLLGTSAGVAFVAGVLALATVGGSTGAILTSAVLLGIPLTLLLPGVSRLRRQWQGAIEAGREEGDRKDPPEKPGPDLTAPESAPA